MEYIVISHASALRYWVIGEASQHPDDCRYDPRPWDVLSAATARFAGELDRFAERAAIDTLVFERAKRNVRAGQKLHLWEGSLPAGSLCQVSEHVLIASPELLYVLMAQTLSVQELIACGTALCSSYPLAYLRHGSALGQTLTTIARLSDYVSLLGGRRGAKKARKALRWVSEGAASVREAEIAIRLFTSRHFGGDGLPKAHLNYRIELDDVARMMAGRQYCVADFAWPEHNLILEYDSNLHHAGVEALERDARRRNALLHMGYEVVTYTNDIVTSAKTRQSGTEQLEARLYQHRRRPYDAPVEVRMQLERAAHLIPRGLL